MGDLHLAFSAEQEVVKDLAPWWHLEMKEEINAQSRKAPSAPLVISAGGFCVIYAVC